MEFIYALAFIGLIILILKAIRGTARGVYKGVTGNDPKVNAARAAAGKRPRAYGSSRPVDLTAPGGADHARAVVAAERARKQVDTEA
jgi:hypothetical protein